MSFTIDPAHLQGTQNQVEMHLYLLSKCLDGYDTEYEELTSRWRSLDVKAQANAAVNGVFLAATFAYVRGIVQDASALTVAFLSVSVLLLGASVVFSVLAMALRQTGARPYGPELHKHVSRLLEGATLASMNLKLTGLQRLLIATHQQANSTLDDGLAQKSKYLLWAQGVLIVAVLGVVTATLLEVANST